ncbi:MAG: ATP-grasp domain-containing protein [Ruminococcaceae bacterium]|nr:ATP-grasp domain-containing protein [Oscillospiraceae bacterium]
MAMKALVLAGGFPQIALIEELRRRGIFTILADYYENPVAKSHADLFYQASTLDVEAITEIAKKEKVDFLITACTDQALLTVARVSETLGLPCYIDYQTALNVTNKQYMKMVFNQYNISTAKHVIMAELDVKRLEEMQYPLIVKPVDCNSSKGVKRVENLEELKVAFAAAVRFSRTDTALVEEFIDGEELSVDVYVEDGVAHVLSVSSLDKIANNDKFVIFRGRYSADVVERVHELVRGIAQQIADAFGLKNSPMLIQMITDGERAFVLEFSARTGGGVKYLLIQKASGFDVISAVVDLTLGKKPHVEKVTPQNRYIANEFIYCKPGRFDRLDGFEELKTDGTISDYYLFKWQGAEFDTIENSGDRVGGFTVQADTMEALREKHRRAVAAMRVLDDRGNDMMRRDLLTDIE